jgi:hypothetical protein
VSAETYRFLHLIAMFALAASLGGLVGLARAGGHAGFRRVLVATNGTALLVMLVAGFGMLAKLKLGMPGWIYAKLAVWLLLGVLLIPIRKQPGAANLWYAAALGLGAIGTWLALYKPL